MGKKNARHMHTHTRTHFIKQKIASNFHPSPLSPLRTTALKKKLILACTNRCEHSRATHGRLLSKHYLAILSTCAIPSNSCPSAVTSTKQHLPLPPPSPTTSVVIADNAPVGLPLLRLRIDIGHQIMSRIASTACFAPPTLQTAHTHTHVSVSLAPPHTPVKSNGKPTWKSILVISTNPSDTLGSLYRDAKPLNAMCGSMVRDSRFVCVCGHGTSAWISIRIPIRIVQPWAWVM